MSVFFQLNDSQHKVTLLHDVAPRIKNPFFYPHTGPNIELFCMPRSNCDLHGTAVIEDFEQFVVISFLSHGANLKGTSGQIWSNSIRILHSHKFPCDESVPMASYGGIDEIRR